MPAKSDPREVPLADRYVYRRPLGVRDLIPAIGAGLVAGAAVFYVASILIQRTPLVPSEADGSDLPSIRRGPRSRSRA